MATGKAVAVLCGDLNMLRCFAKTDIPTVLVSSDPKNVTFYSRHCRHKKVIANPLSEPDKTILDLVALGQQCSEKPVLFYGDDTLLLLVSRNRKLLEKYYRFLLPDPDLVEALVDKTRFASLANRLGLPVPKTLLPQQVKTAEEIGQHLSLPCILKPDLRVGWFESETIRDEGRMPRKMLRADTLIELTRLLKEMQLFTKNFVIQEYIAGGDDCIFSFHAYVNDHSEVLAYFVGRKIRTYPRDSGVSTYLELVEEPEVVRLGLDILRKLNCVGVVKIDFKKNVNRDRFYLLEVNPRFNLWSYLGAVCGVNLPQVAYADLLGETCKPQEGYQTGVKWLSFGNDLRTFIREYRKNGDLSWGRWLLSYRGRKIYDVFSWDDPYPFVLCLLNYAKMLFRRLLSGAAK